MVDVFSGAFEQQGLKQKDQFEIFAGGLVRAFAFAAQ